MLLRFWSSLIGSWEIDWFYRLARRYSIGTDFCFTMQEADQGTNQLLINIKKTKN